MVSLGSQRLLAFGGYNNDEEGFVPPMPPTATLHPAAMGMQIAIGSIEPASAPVEGGVSLTLNGVGFQRDLKYKVRFTVPHPPPEPRRPTDDKSAAPLIFLADTEEYAVVDATVVDGSTLTCTTPDLSAMLCDGRVLVEASADSVKLLWTSDEVELQLTSTVDKSRLRLKGTTVGVVGTPSQMTLHTFDHRSRRRSTGGDKFTCALRNDTALPEEEGQEVPLLTTEEAAVDLDNGTHVLTYRYERAGHFLFSVRLDAQIVTEVPITLQGVRHACGVLRA
jgi:Filamin/ABP280 repeat./IPT/TIG domain.